LADVMGESAPNESYDAPWRFGVEGLGFSPWTDLGFRV
jgi:hypothetical protein